MDNGNFILERRPEILASYLEEIRIMADSERNALSFWPIQQLREASERGKLWAALDNGELQGFLIFSGVFPHAKIQAIATTQSARKKGVAASLMRAFVSEHERLGYISIKAEVASDLVGALKFYASQGFEKHSTKAGGKARKRSIVVHILELDTDTLFSVAEPQIQETNLGLHRRVTKEAPFYAFDLNVYLDLARDRVQSEDARRLFGAALAHQIKLRIASEFVVELQRNAYNAPSKDPILQLALRLPKIPAAEEASLVALSQQIHDLIFSHLPKEKPSTSQSRSDASHLAHAALARASAFVTRDRALLDARELLLEAIGIDVIDVKELLELLPSQTSQDGETKISTVGQGFRVSDISKENLEQYLLGNHIESSLIQEFCTNNNDEFQTIRMSIQLSRKIVAIGVLLIPLSVEPTARILIHIQPETPNFDLFTDHILDKLIHRSCDTLPTAISLAYVAGQPEIRSHARLRGFSMSPATKDMIKIALGRPVTRESWSAVGNSMRRRTGITLQEKPPKSVSTPISITNQEGVSYEVQLTKIEDILSPTVVLCSERTSVIVPIAKNFADELLGTSKQKKFDFLEDKDAAFSALRSYVNSPRMASRMRPQQPILFYESLPNGGRGAVVAIARIIDTVVIRKSDIDNSRLKRLVVEDVNGFSASEEILLTTFDNLFEFPRPVSIAKLRQIGAAKASFVSPEVIDGQIAEKIVNWGWEYK